MSEALKPKTSMSEAHMLHGVARGAEAFALARLQQAAPALLHVCVNDRSLRQMAEALEFFAPDTQVIALPAWDTLPYDRTSPMPAIVAERMEALARIVEPAGGNTIILTTANALLQHLPPRETIRSASFVLQVGKKISMDAFAKFLAESGYRRAEKVMEAGEYAQRGGLLDVLPPGMEEGLRLDFFGDELESIRLFDPITQRSSGTRDGFTLLGASEVVLNPQTIEQFRTKYREQFGVNTAEDTMYQAVSEGAAYPGMEQWLPLFYDHTETLLDYVPDAKITFEAQAFDAIAERHEAIADYYQARVDALKSKHLQEYVYHPIAPEQLYIMPTALEQKLAARDFVEFSSFVPANAQDALPITLSLPLKGGSENPIAWFKEFAASKRAGGKSTLLAALSNGSRERLAHMLGEAGVHALKVEHFDAIKDVSGKTVGLAVLPMENGFEGPDFCIVSEQDLLGERVIRSRPKRKRSEAFLAEVANFMEGELIVHREHGIGRYAGLVTVEVNSAKHDCLKLVYADDDRLFLPVENMELISRYGAEDENAKLDKLGQASWQARKAKIKERIKIAAETLLKTAAARELKEGAVVSAERQAYELFSAQFPYAETDDQARSIEEVEQDLTSGRSMDRLICGDVGFGKTEVALRAAFLAATGSQKVQVAVVVPTTLLSRQHFKNFAARFKDFPVVVKQLSRMVNTREQAEVKLGLKEGSVDIVIGTHALLAKNIEFKNLGLVIIDEEQHFGVVQKERLKQMKSEVHVLTLSATPIPRTMQMALSGVRSLSLITTPPVDRLAIRSFVMPFDPVVIREAVLREKHRGGRVFVVTPRIKDIAELKVQLEALLPEVTMRVAHGQMPPTELDTIMNDFYDGKFDLLISTAIIESGLDIPTANTIIIHRADRFGLSQLYQMRGRVGRGKQRAYAYFLLPSRKELTKQATRRLEVMQTLDSLGAGFTVASHDMDIRGFGNLVGEEQSGHIKEVGIELYQQMLAEAVELLKQEKRGQTTEADSKDWSPQINLGLPVLIPEDYVPDLQLRLGLYKRAADLQNQEELDSFAAELIDRFGKMPEEVEYLLSTMAIKAACKHAHIARVDAGPKGILFSFHKDFVKNPEKLLAYIQKHPTTLRLRPDQKLIFMKEFADVNARTKAVTKVVQDIAHNTH